MNLFDNKQRNHLSFPLYLMFSLFTILFGLGMNDKAIIIMIVKMPGAK